MACRRRPARVGVLLGAGDALKARFALRRVGAVSAVPDPLHEQVELLAQGLVPFDFIADLLQLRALAKYGLTFGRQFVDLPLRLHGDLLERVIDADHVLCVQTFLQRRQARDELLDGQLPGLVDVQHLPGLRHVISRHVHAQLLHAGVHDFLRDQRRELLPIQDAVAVCVGVHEALAQEFDERLVHLLLLFGFVVLPVRCRGDDGVGGNGSKHRDHGPRSKRDEHDKEGAPQRVDFDQRVSYLAPIVNRHEVKQAVGRGGHV
mmetsp:Transcript_54948/g.166991  ORF Transcript_54948/g.166991 Transcript_54948/m.166991 type:complete len:262 (-) Transcript_54948:809-1594(-)